jgi:glycopeptide antibiotics resistance protein
MQLKPFYTIYNILKRGTMNSILKNILGNIIALIPLSFLLMIKDKKYNNILRQLLIIIPIIIFIELFQSYSHTGSLDIDDIILNCLGPIIFTFLITRFNLIEKIRKMFYTDFSVKKKEMLFYISTIIIIIVDIMMFII